MENKHILIVEDEWVIYDELASFLTKKDYKVAPYTKSYEEAINQIKSQMPDMVLLDINLQGEKDGIDLGDQLFKEFDIPFLYLTAYTDELTVNRARRTSPDSFLIKTKPNIDKEQLFISIKMALSRKKHSIPENKDGIFVFTNYFRDNDQAGFDKLKKVLLKFDDILWINTDTQKRNYLICNTVNSTSYLKNSLLRIKEIFPYYFVRINAKEIINLKKVEGKVNHSSFKINGKNFKIGPNYSVEVHKVLHSFYYE